MFFLHRGQEIFLDFRIFSTFFEIKHLKINDIETTIGTYSLSSATYYYNKYQSIQENSYYLENNTITFPCYENLDTKRIFDVIVGYVNNVR